LESITPILKDKLYICQCFPYFLAPKTALTVPNQIGPCRHLVRGARSKDLFKGRFFPKPNSSTGQTKVEFAYDALASRIEKKDLVDPNKTTRYYYNNNWQVLAEYDGSNNLQRYFVYGNYIDEVLLMNDGANEYYYVHDHLYSPVALINTNDTVVERYEYDAYCNVQILDASYEPRETSEYNNPSLLSH